VPEVAQSSGENRDDGGGSERREAERTRWNSERLSAKAYFDGRLEPSDSVELDGQDATATQVSQSLQ
jgi:hypothetical protein